MLEIATNKVTSLHLPYRTFFFLLTDNSRSPTPPSRELSVIEKGITPTTYTFNSSSETNGYIPAETKSNFLTANLDNGASQS